MFGPLGFPEMLFIVVLALLIFGPKKLPEVGRTIGKGMAQFRKATSDLKRTIETEIALEEQPARPIGPPASQPRRIGPERAPERGPDLAPERTADRSAASLAADAPLPEPLSAPESETPVASPADEPGPGESRPS
jgi:TatA/E family protein of Tat protein translocase